MTCPCGEPARPRVTASGTAPSLCADCKEARKKVRWRRAERERYRLDAPKFRQRGRAYYARNKVKCIAKSTARRHKNPARHNELCAGYRWEGRVKRAFGGHVPTDPTLLEMLAALRKFRSEYGGRP